jgi:hypothetical protein
MSILSLACLTSFAAKFNPDEANAFTKAKDWAGLQNYMKTHTEIEFQDQRKIVTNLNLIVRGKITKDITKENFIQEIQKAAKENNLAKEDQIFLLYSSRVFTKDLTITESAKLALNYFAENNFKIQDLKGANLSSIFFSYMMLNDIKNATVIYKEIIKKSPNKSVRSVTRHYNNKINKFSLEEKIEYAKMSDDGKYIITFFILF